MKNLSIFSFLLCLLLCFAACEGPMGEPGLDGKDGIDGVDGGNGVDGEDGRDGNANVKTYSFDIHTRDFGYNSTIEARYYYQTLPKPVSTNDAVLIYLYRGNWTGGGEYWSTLPFTQYFNTGSYGIQHAYAITNNGNIRLEIRSSDAEDRVGVGTLYYRAVVIEGTTSGKQALETDVDLASLKCGELNEALRIDTDVNLCDYEQVAAYFGLEN